MLASPLEDAGQQPDSHMQCARVPPIVDRGMGPRHGNKEVVPRDQALVQPEQ
jgi:hypothetical protein